MTDKTLFELILPVQQRIDEVTDFLKSIDTSLDYEVVPIQDAFGPTKTDANLDASFSFSFLCIIIYSNILNIYIDDYCQPGDNAWW